MSRYQQQQGGRQQQAPQQYQAPVLEITDAVKADTWLRMALIGISGSGKTFSALSIAQGLGGNVLVIDTEHGSAAKYGDLFSFKTIKLNNYDPRNYIEGLRLGEMSGFDVIIIDSLSHAWSGRGGALEIVDNITKRTNSGNSFAAWRDVTPLHNLLVDAIVGCQAHVIVTMRAKTEYVYDGGENGKKGAPRKVGMAPVQREGMEYEFDVCGEINQNHEFIVSKSRVPWLADQIYQCPGQKLGEDLLGWLGKPVRVERQEDQYLPPTPQPNARPQLVTPELLAEYKEVKKRYEDLGLGNLYDLSPDDTAKKAKTWIGKALSKVNHEEARVEEALAEQERRQAEAAAAAAEQDDSDPFVDDEVAVLNPAAPAATSGEPEAIPPAPAPPPPHDDYDDSDPFDGEETPESNAVTPEFPGQTPEPQDPFSGLGDASAAPAPQPSWRQPAKAKSVTSDIKMTQGQWQQIQRLWEKIHGRKIIAGDLEPYKSGSPSDWSMSEAATIIEILEGKAAEGTQ